MSCGSLAATAWPTDRGDCELSKLETKFGEVDAFYVMFNSFRAGTRWLHGEKKNSSQNRKQVFMKFGIMNKVFKLHGAYLKNVPKTAKTFVVLNFMNTYSLFCELFFLRVLQGYEPFTINPITLCLPLGRSKP